jgi:hypothetical protein
MRKITRGPREVFASELNEKLVSRFFLIMIVPRIIQIFGRKRH